MNEYFNSRAGRFALAVIFSTGIASVAIAQVSKPQPTASQRQAMSERHIKLSEMHTKMASCLESDKTFAVCRQEMIDSCSKNFSGKCPLMDVGKMGGGMGG